MNISPSFLFDPDLELAFMIRAALNIGLRSCQSFCWLYNTYDSSLQLGQMIYIN